ncbi:MAG: hypothetical protein JSU63_02055 [Phycisphaerales bacterium]|nr:MAG: hypothetical protein JSU63_02055 [Phycisphaerales bacterium]
MQYRQVSVFAGKGTGADRFAETLYGIGIDAADLIYAVGDSEVKVFDTQGRLQQRWATEKPGYCVSISADRTVYVGEIGQVELFDAGGRRKTAWTDPERLGFVTSIGFFGDNVFIADAKDRCIRRYNKSGEWINNIGKDNRTKGFLIPNGYLDFAVDKEGVLHVANPAKHRIERYTMNDELLGYFGRFGTRQPEDFPGCCNPTNLTLTRQGDVVVTEKAAPRLKFYDRSGKFLTFVGPELFDPNCKNMDIAVDSQGRVYVLDTIRLNIHVFACEGGAD